jgi:erythromycin esterase-like protein
VHSLEKGAVSTTLFAVAIAFHFLAVDHELREHHGEDYQRIGRYLMAGAALLGWGLGLLGEVPRAALALLVAFVSGAVIMNSAVMELPAEKEGRVWPFVGGGILYGLILLPLG